MLCSLHIYNYALIEHLDLELTAGFSVVTGETGAGKSILLGALGLLTGKRADTKAIKTGVNKCVVEAVFNVEQLGLESLFTRADIDFDGAECILRREVSASGKSRAFINDTPVTLADLQELSNHLVDIHSQHQNLFLGDRLFLLAVLDSFAVDEQLPLLYKEKYQDWQQASRELKALQDEAARNQSEADYMQFQLSRLDEATLQVGEQEELEAEQEQLAHSEDIKAAFYRVVEHLTSEQEDIIGGLRSDRQALDNVSSVFPQAETLGERIESVRIELQDIADEAEQTAERLDFDPQRLAWVEERLSTLYDLQKKHGKTSVAELIALRDSLREKLARVENVEDLIRQKTVALEQVRKEMQAQADALTVARKAAAEVLVGKMLRLTTELGMPNARLQIAFTKNAPMATGQDEVEMLFSANKNVPPQNVARVASGGEIARLMLALKAAVAERKALPTIFFDEIDTGVSGRQADAMAGVMDAMARHCQVICITHLPQIAAVGTAHYKVFKQESAAETTSQIVPLNEEMRLQEIAGMLSGQKITEAALHNARELLASRFNEITPKHPR